MNEEQEIEVAEWVERLVREHLGEEPGPRTPQDGKVSPDLTVDFTYEETTPRFALEITRLTDYFERDPDEYVKAFEQEVERGAKQIGWPHWFVGYRAETSLKGELAKSVVTMMKFAMDLGVKELGAATYVHDLGADLASRMTAEFYRACDQARLRGVVYVAKREAGGVATLRVEETSDSRSLRRPLERTMAAKSVSLAKAKKRGYWTMLAIDVERGDAHGYVDDYRLPGVPTGIDHVWLFVRRNGELNRAYYANRVDRRLVLTSP